MCPASRPAGPGPVLSWKGRMKKVMRILAFLTDLRPPDPEPIPDLNLDQTPGA